MIKPAAAMRMEDEYCILTDLVGMIEVEGLIWFQSELFVISVQAK